MSGKISFQLHEKNMTKEIPAAPEINHNNLQSISNTKGAVIFFPQE